MINFVEPISGFIVVADNQGQVVDFDGPNFNQENLNELVEYLNINFPSKAPYSVWKCSGSFERVNVK